MEKVGNLILKIFCEDLTIERMISSFIKFVAQILFKCFIYGVGDTMDTAYLKRNGKRFVYYPPHFMHGHDVAAVD